MLKSSKFKISNMQHHVDDFSREMNTIRIN